MNQQRSPIKHVSDTARWMAFYRAMESERPNAHFRDPYARHLAGERGKAIAYMLPWGISNAWSLIVRTCIFDEIIMKTVENHAVDTVLNLAAGFDTRPYRLSLPTSLRWIEVDLPDILAEKEKKLANECPRCCLTRVPLDLADVEARRALFSRLARDTGQALVVTEGLLTYLTAEQVTALACDLRTQAPFRWWLIDLVAPFVLSLYNIWWDSELRHGNASWQFAPEEGAHFFSRVGWHAAEFRSTMEEAARLNRDMLFGPLWRLMIRYSGKAVQETYRKMSGSLLLERD